MVAEQTPAVAVARSSATAAVSEVLCEMRDRMTAGVALDWRKDSVNVGPCMGRLSVSETALVETRVEMTDSPAVTVCIPTYNRRKLLAASLQSVREHSFGDVEIIVSDNASTDDTGDYVRSLNDPRIRYARLEENVGLFVDLPSPDGVLPAQKWRIEMLCWPR